MVLSLVRRGLCLSLRLTGSRLSIVHTAGVCSKSKRGGPIHREKPWDYDNKPYGYFQRIYDKTSWRFNENTKIIVVDGPIASGKTAFCKTLAEELELFHLPEITSDDLYMNSYGFDLRTLNSELPENCQSFDLRDFNEKPRHENVALFQVLMFQFRVLQYVDALCHLMNTGQGVLLERSWLSDFVFLNAMCECGYVSQKAKDLYNLIKTNVAPFLMKPHLAIYLDVPPHIVQERIKKRSISYEVNSKAITPKYLECIDKYYKQEYLRDIDIYSELLVYDWSEGGEVEVVIEDIEKLDFDKYSWADKKLEDWSFSTELDLCAKRILYTKKKEKIHVLMNVIPAVDCPELALDGLSARKKYTAIASAPGNEYAKGFNSNCGDGGYLFKITSKYRDPIKHY